MDVAVFIVASLLTIFMQAYWPNSEGFKKTGTKTGLALSFGTLIVLLGVCISTDIHRVLGFNSILSPLTTNVLVAELASILFFTPLVLNAYMTFIYKNHK